MNWECTATYYPSSCLCGGAVHGGRTGEPREGGRHCKSWILSFMDSHLLRNWSDLSEFLNFTCFMEVSCPHTLLLSFSLLLSICSAYVRKCLRTFHGSVRQRKTVCGSTPKIKAQNSEENAWVRFRVISAACAFCRSTFAQRKAAVWGAQVGALSKVSTARSAQLRRSHQLALWTRLDPK